MSSQGIQIIRGCLNHLAIQYRSSGDSEFYKNRTDVTTLIGRVDQAVKRTFQEGKEKEAWKAFSKDVQPLINLKKQVCQIAQDDVRLQENLMNEVQALTPHLSSIKKIQNTWTATLSPQEMLEKVNTAFNVEMKELEKSLGLVPSLPVPVLNIPTIQQRARQVQDSVDREDDYSFAVQTQSVMREQNFFIDKPQLFILMNSLINSIAKGVYGKSVQKIDMLTQQQLLKLLFLEGVRASIPLHITELRESFSKPEQLFLKRAYIVFRSKKYHKWFLREVKNSLDFEKSVLKRGLQSITINRADETFYLQFLLKGLSEKRDPPIEVCEDNLLKFLASSTRHKILCFESPDAVVSIDAFYQDILRKGRNIFSFLQTTNRKDLIDCFQEGLQDILSYEDSPDKRSPIIQLFEGMNAYTESLYQRGQELTDATKKGDLLKVRQLLKEGSGVFTKTRGWSVKIAAFQGRMDIIQELLSDKEPISKESLGWSVIDSVEGRHIDVLRVLLGEGDIFPEARGEALTMAVRNGDLASVQSLLKGGAKVPKSYREESLKVAMSKREGDIMQELLKDGDSTSISYRALALRVAIDNNYLAVFRALLQSGSSFSKSTVGFLVRVATRKRLLDIVQALLQHEPNISKLDREKALKIAMESNQEHLVQELIKGHFGLAVKVAVLRGNFLAVKKLLQEGSSLSKEERGQAVFIAAEHGYLPIIRALLKKSHSISESVRKLAVEVAMTNGHQAVVSYLSASQPPFKVSSNNYTALHRPLIVNGIRS